MDGDWVPGAFALIVVLTVSGILPGLIDVGFGLTLELIKWGFKKIFK